MYGSTFPSSKSETKKNFQTEEILEGRLKSPSVDTEDENVCHNGTSKNSAAYWALGLMASPVLILFALVGYQQYNSASVAVVTSQTKMIAKASETIITPSSSVQIKLE